MLKVFTLFTVAAALPAADMPVVQQNALVQKYCAVCHTDASMNGGLTLQHFDAAHADPGLAAMMVSKLKGKALGASGQPLPDRATQDALEAALTAESQGSSRWVIQEGPVLTASVVRQVENDLYRLTVSCRLDRREGSMQLAWSPDVLPDGHPVSVAADGSPAVIYKVAGVETMGNGQKGTSGPGAMSLPAAPLPTTTLEVSHLFRDENVVFPFDQLDPKFRGALAACMAR
jgi:hypothetical protein